MKVYICHTYGRRWGLTDEECERNAEKSIEWGRKLILKGHNPYIPNLFHYVHKAWAHSPDEQKYFDLVSDWISACDCLFVAELPPWKNSGVHQEIEIAKAHQMPVYYKLSEVPDER